jgi:hypothetical protein
MESSTASIIGGRVLSGLAIAFLTMDGVMKFIDIPAVAEASAQLGWPMSANHGIGIVLLTCVALYALPPTAVLGAILLTGYLGGAVAVHVRVGNPLPTHVLFPVYVGLFIWGGLWLRDPGVRALLPLRSAAS